MALQTDINRRVIVTCAVTGAGDTVGKHPAIPVTPQQIADAALEAAKAGATVAHIHVRNPETGKASRDPALYREVVDRIRSSGVDIIINLTAGMGGDFFFDPENPSKGGRGTDIANAAERVAHVEELRPEICTLDCGSLNFGDGLAIVLELAPGLAGFGIANMQMRDGSAGLGRLDGGVGDLLGRHRNGRMLADRIARAGHGAADDDVLVHGAVSLGSRRGRG